MSGASSGTGVPDGASDGLSVSPGDSRPAPLPPAAGAGSDTAAPGGVVDSPTSGKWHATYWPAATSRISGSTWAQCSWARGQRVRNRQPDGGSSGDGRSPGTSPDAWAGTVGSGTGIDDSSAAVYGCAGDE